MIYDNLQKNPKPIVEVKNKISYNFVDGAFVEIKGTRSLYYLVKFINDDTNEVVYETRITNNQWARTSTKYFIRWRIEIYEKNHLVFHHVYNATDKTVLISFDSSSLGDNIAWMPYVLEFKKKHNCHVIVSTFKNFLFQDAYPELEFVNPGSKVDDLYASYLIGWFYDKGKEPALANTVPLQKTATNILGLDFQEIVPNIAYTPCNKFDGKYVTIATNSTAGCKFWTREGWQEVINFLHGKGYKVINISKEDNPFEHCQPLEDKSMQNTMDAIASSSLFIGLSSGLSWLAWAMKKPVVMIANFTEEDHEFSCTRVTNTKVCHGCWNKPEFRFDRGDWNWCPVHKGTDRMFECQQTITAQEVINALTKHITS